MSAMIPATLEGYYRRHAGIYDATRWSFLFGRSGLIRKVSRLAAPRSILEVGCGTGRNLRTLLKTFPGARITGIDLSPEMLEKARETVGGAGGRIRLLRGAYGPGMDHGGPHDLILFSYCLSMIDPGRGSVLDQAKTDLSEDGRIAVVDFASTKSSFFRRWMAMNHVRMDGDLHRMLLERFDPQWRDRRSAYGGLWTYLLFVGGKKTIRRP